MIGEGEKDEAPMLHNGEEIGDGSPPQVDIAVDPLEGTRLCALGMPSAIAVIALAERGTMFDPGPIVYMEKMAAGERFADLLDLDRPLERDRRADRRAQGLRRQRRDGGRARPAAPRARASRRSATPAARVQLITDGDVSGALNAVSPDRQADFLWGIGGTPEGVITAAAVKCIGGALVGRLWPRDDDERKAAVDAGYDLERVLTHDDLVHGEDVFFSATGVTDGDVLQGVRYEGARGASTESLVMRSRSGHGAADPVAPRPLEAARGSPATQAADQQRRARRAAAAASAPTSAHGVSPTVTGFCSAAGRRSRRGRRSGRRPTPPARASPASAGSRA